MIQFEIETEPTIWDFETVILCTNFEFNMTCFAPEPSKTRVISGNLTVLSSQNFLNDENIDNRVSSISPHAFSVSFINESKYFAITLSSAMWSEVTSGVFVVPMCVLKLCECSYTAI